MYILDSAVNKRALTRKKVSKEISNKSIGAGDSGGLISKHNIIIHEWQYFILITTV